MEIFDLGHAVDLPPSTDRRRSSADERSGESAHDAK